MKKFLFFLWIISALGTLLYFNNLFGIGIPVFVIVWLALAFLVVLVSGKSDYVGFKSVKADEFFLVLLLNLLFLSLIFIVLEPLSNTFKHVIDQTMRIGQDPAYFWLNRYTDWKGLLFFFLTNFFIVVFAEELFFRGFIIQFIGLKLSKFWGVLIQAFLFLAFVVLLNYNIPPVENYILLVVYTFFARGIIGGWAAARTDSIWPSLISTSLVYTGIIFIYFYYPYLI